MIPEVPKRGSSAAKSSKRADKKSTLDLEILRDYEQNKAKTLLHSLKPQASFSSAYWIQNAEAAMASKKAAKLQKRISRRYHRENGIEGEFRQSEKAIRLREQLHALAADEELFRKQAEVVSTGDLDKTKRRAFIELYTTSKMGLGINDTGRGRRDTSDQSNFRAACIKAYNASDPDPTTKLLWCPVTKSWVPKDLTNAAHIFAYAHGQTMMNSVFGIMEEPELFSPRNGMIVSQLVEKKFDKGFMAIVPRLPDNPTQSEIAEWNLSEPKEYKVRILDPESPEAGEVIRPDPRLTWKDLDGTPVEFKSAFRPRARYLYFHYCIQILRRAWRAERKAAEQMKKEFGKGYWGTIGPYLPKCHLQALVDELGHGYEELLEGGVDDQATASDVNGDVVVALGSNQVKASREEGEDEESDSDDEESDDEQDDYYCE
jgi:HNH endonuclease